MAIYQTVSVDRRTTRRIVKRWPTALEAWDFARRMNRRGFVSYVDQIGR